MLNLALVFFSLLQIYNDSVDIPSGEKALCHRFIHVAFSFFVVLKMTVFLTMGGVFDLLKSTVGIEGEK